MNQQEHNKIISESLQAGAEAAMKIFDRVDAMKTKQVAYLHTAELKDEKDVSYFVSKLQDLENQYHKTEVHAYDKEGKLLATMPTVNIQDTTDLTQGLSTLRNTLNGFVNMHKKIKADVLQSGINYSNREGHAA
jgi:ABC-type antimicrobial peptide transport system ATPase subunit